MICTRVAVAVTLLLGSATNGLAQLAPDPAEIQRRSTLVKPSADELRWQQIPWQTDLTEGLRLARQEGRPLFLWVTGDEPLERC